MNNFLPFLAIILNYPWFSATCNILASTVLQPSTSIYLFEFPSPLFLLVRTYGRAWNVDMRFSLLTIFPDMALWRAGWVWAIYGQF